MSPTRRAVAVVLAVAATAAAMTLLPVGHLRAEVAKLGPAAPWIWVVLAVGLLVALVPRTPISLACGALFGPATGAAIAVMVALAASAITFAASRRLGDAVLARLAGQRWTRLQGWIDREGVLGVAAVRALPLGPYGLVGYAYGSSTISVRPYALGTLIAAVPSAVAYALIGAAATTAAKFSFVSLIPLCFALTLLALVALRARRDARRARG